MSRVVIIGGGAADMAAQLEALGLTTISTAQAFRALVETLPGDFEASAQPEAPKFGSDRPYLKKKKGRT